MKFIKQFAFSWFSLTLSVVSYGQVIYTPAVISTYDSVYNKLDARLQRMVNNPENRMRGVVLLTGFQLDTLNKQDLIAGRVRADSSHSGYIPETILTPDLMVGRAKGSGDSLTISISPWFMMGDEIKHKINGDQVMSQYRLWEKENRVLASNTLISDRKDFVLSATASIILSDKNFAPGKTLYGSSVLVTDDFTQVQTPDFKGGIMRLRAKYSYVFKLIALKDDGL